MHFQICEIVYKVLRNGVLTIQDNGALLTLIYPQYCTVICVEILFPCNVRDQEQQQSGIQEGRRSREHSWEVAYALISLICFHS